MDALTIRPSSQDRLVTPAREGTKRDAQDQQAAEQLSQAEARRRAQQQQDQQNQLRRQADKDMAEQQNRRLGGRLVRIGDNRAIENTAEARAGVMRDKVQRAYTSTSQQQNTAADDVSDNTEATTDSPSRTDTAAEQEPIDLII